MKRLLLSIVLALAIHGLIFCFGGKWQKSRSYPQMSPHPVTLSLPYLPSTKAAVDHQPLPAHEKKTGNMLMNEPGKKDEIVEQPLKRSEPPDASGKTDIPVTTGVTAAAPAFTLMQPPAGKGDPEKDQKKAQENIQQAYESTAKEMPPSPVPQIIDKEAVPLYKENPAPGYPRIAKKRGYQGTVVLEVLVTKEGRAGKVTLFQSSHHSVLDDAAVSSVRKWRFEPGEKGNKKVDMWVKIPIRFELETEE